MRTLVARAVDRSELPATSDVELLSLLPLAILQYWRPAHELRPDESVVARIVDQFYKPTPSVPPGGATSGEQ
jgi:hypothetical protein